MQLRFSNNTTNEPGLKPSLNTNLHDEVAVLPKENFYLKTEVESLNRRVNFILSFLEIFHNEERINMAVSSPSTSQHTSQHTDIDPHHDPSANIRHQTIKTTLQQSVLSTFHNALHKKDKRKRNVIVKGLRPSFHTDEDLFSNLFLKEFNL